MDSGSSDPSIISPTKFRSLQMKLTQANAKVTQLQDLNRILQFKLLSKLDNDNEKDRSRVEEKPVEEDGRTKRTAVEKIKISRDKIKTSREKRTAKSREKRRKVARGMRRITARETRRKTAREKRRQHERREERQQERREELHQERRQRL